MKHVVEFAAELEKSPPEEMLGRITLDQSFYEYGGTPLKQEYFLKAEELEATNPHEKAGWSITAWDKDYAFTGFKEMLYYGKQLVSQGHRGGVALNARVKPRTHLGKACNELQLAAGMSTIAPSRSFTFGEPPNEHHPGDPR